VTDDIFARMRNRSRTLFGLSGELPAPHPHDAADISGVFTSITVAGDLWSANWDGALPIDLSGGADATATVGFALDSTVGAGQFQSLYAEGGEIGDLTITGMLRASGDQTGVFAGTNWDTPATRFGTALFYTTTGPVSGLYFYNGDGIQPGSLLVVPSGKYVQLESPYDGTVPDHYASVQYQAGATAALGKVDWSFGPLLSHAIKVTFDGNKAEFAYDVDITTGGNLLKGGSAWAHSDNASIGTDDHHAKSHGHTGADGSGTVAHSDTTGQTTDDHHAKSHGHTGADGSGTVSHDNLDDVSVNDHHDKLHNHDGVDGSGNVSHDDLTFVSINDHHNRDHASEHNLGGADELSPYDIGIRSDFDGVATITPSSPPERCDGSVLATVADPGGSCDIEMHLSGDLFYGSANGSADIQLSYTIDGGSSWTEPARSQREPSVTGNVPHHSFHTMFLAENVNPTGTIELTMYVNSVPTAANFHDVECLLVVRPR